MRGGSKMIAALSEDMILTPGAEVAFTFDPAKAHPFPEVG